MLTETRCAIRCRPSWMYALWVYTFPMAGVAETPPQHPIELVVKYSDLDLTRMSAIAELYRRLGQAARLVCTSVTAETGAVPSAVCVSDALARAVSEINEPALTRYAASRAAPSHPPK
jgi:UrcA family protein